MKIRAALVIVALVSLSIYITTTWSPLLPAPEAQVVIPVVDVPPDAAALSGIWEGLGPADLPVRLIVDNVHGHWATVRYTWGDQPEGTFHRGWVRARALVFPGGKLFWRHPGDFTFQLADDWTTLVGKREQGGSVATSLMRRVPSDLAPEVLIADTRE